MGNRCIRPVHVINVFAPYDIEERRTFLIQLKDLIGTIPAEDSLILGGDFNDSINLMKDRYAPNSHYSLFTKLQNPLDPTSTAFNQLLEDANPVSCHDLIEDRSARVDFTYESPKGTLHIIDHIVLRSSAMQQPQNFPTCRVNTSSCIRSDHRPVHLEVCSEVAGGARELPPLAGIPARIKTVQPRSRKHGHFQELVSKQILHLRKDFRDPYITEGVNSDSHARRQHRDEAIQAFATIVTDAAIETYGYRQSFNTRAIPHRLQNSWNTNTGYTTPKDL